MATDDKKYVQTDGAFDYTQVICDKKDESALLEQMAGWELLWVPKGSGEKMYHFKRPKQTA